MRPLAAGADGLVHRFKYCNYFKYLTDTKTAAAGSGTAFWAIRCQSPIGAWDGVRP